MGRSVYWRRCVFVIILAPTKIGPRNESTGDSSERPDWHLAGSPSLKLSDPTFSCALDRWASDGLVPGGNECVLPESPSLRQEERFQRYRDRHRPMEELRRQQSLALATGMVQPR